MKWKVTLVFAALLLQSTLPAHAGLRAQPLRSNSVATGSWAAVAYGQGQTPANSAYVISWTVNQGKARDFFAFRNTGNFVVIGITATFTPSQTSNNGKPPSTSIDLCQNGAWNTTLNTCSGTIVQYGPLTDVPLVLNFNNINLAAGSELSMRATTQPNLQNSYTTTISVSVPRSQIRSGIVSNS